jgi:hypothetical protein
MQCMTNKIKLSVGAALPYALIAGLEFIGV